MKRAYFDELAPRWDSLPCPPDAPARVRRFLVDVLPEGCARVLDAGCGTGILGDGIAAACSSLELLVEMDFAPAMLVEGRRKLGDVRARFLCGDLARLPFAPRSFDVALCFNVLPHVEDPAAALVGLLATVRPGGRLAVGHMMASVLLNELHATIGGPVGADRLAPARELAALMASLGARVLLAREEVDNYLVLVEKPG